MGEEILLNQELIRSEIDFQKLLEEKEALEAQLAARDN